MAVNGGKRPNSGRKPGSTNKVLPEIKQILIDGIKPYLQNLPALLDALEPKDKVDAIIEILPYVCTKFAPQQVDEYGNSPSNNGEQQFTISVKPVDYRLAATEITEGSESDSETSS